MHIDVARERERNESSGPESDRARSALFWIIGTIGSSTATFIARNQSIGSEEVKKSKASKEDSKV